MEQNNLDNEHSDECAVTLTGQDKSIILLGMMGHEGIKPLLPFLGRDEVEQIARGMTRLSSIKKNDAVVVLEEFYKEVTGRVTPDGDYRQAQSLIDEYEEVQIELTPEAGRRQQLKNIFALEDMEPNELFRLLENEHIQVWVIILSQLSSNLCTEVLDFIDKDKKTLILKKLASLKNVDDTILENLNQVLEKKLSSTEDDNEFNGAKATADILSLLAEEDTTSFMDELEKNNKDIYAKVKSYLITFTDLMYFDAATLQKIFAEVDAKIMATAICQSSETVQQNCYASVTKRTRSIIEEEMKSLQQANPTAVRKAQQQIIDTARRLQDQNIISLDIKE